jgi:hypothetical protein
MINIRWNTPEQEGFHLKSPTRDEAMHMSIEELSHLAPSEKFDLLLGDYDYSLVKEVDDHAYKGAPEWYGICHGWAPASLNHSEPTPKTLRSADGIHVPFGSSDIKALLSWYYAYHNDKAPTHQMGKRCFWPYMNPGCSKNDLNAGAFHVTVANTIGLMNQSLILDIEKTELVWNHPLHDYQITVMKDHLAPSMSSAPGTAKRMMVKMDLRYIKESAINTWAPFFLTTGQTIEKVTYQYTLDLDRSGKIIGGDWVGKARPDFLWSMDRVTAFEGKFQRLSELLDD